MKKRKTITRTKLLSLKPPKGEPSESEFMETPAGKKVADEMRRYIESRRSLRSELSDGEDSYKGSYLTMADTIGKSPSTIQEMDSIEFDEWFSAIIRKKRREATHEPRGEDPVMEKAIRLFTETETPWSAIRVDVGCSEDSQKGFENYVRRYFKKTRGQELSEVHKRERGLKSNRNK